MIGLLQSYLTNYAALVAGIVVVLALLVLPINAYRKYLGAIRHCADLEARTDFLHHLAARLVTARDIERDQLALALHEDVAQTLSALKLQLEIRALPNSPVSDAQVEASFKQSIASLRTAAAELQPISPIDAELSEAIYAMCSHYESTRPDLAIHKTLALRGGACPAELRTVICRVVQDTLRGVTQHPSGEEVRLALRDDQRLRQLHWLAVQQEY